MEGFMTSLSMNFWEKGDRVLLIDDFLANGKALEGLAPAGTGFLSRAGRAGIVIEKGFQRGGGCHSCHEGIHLESLAIVDGMNDKTGEIIFREQ